MKKSSWCTTLQLGRARTSRSVSVVLPPLVTLRGEAGYNTAPSTAWRGPSPRPVPLRPTRSPADADDDLHGARGGGPRGGALPGRGGGEGVEDQRQLPGSAIAARREHRAGPRRTGAPREGKPGGCSPRFPRSTARPLGDARPIAALLRAARAPPLAAQGRAAPLRSAHWLAGAGTAPIGTGYGSRPARPS